MVAGNDVYAPLNLPNKFLIVQEDSESLHLDRCTGQAELVSTATPNIYDLEQYKIAIRKHSSLFGSDESLQERILAKVQELERPDQKAIDITWDTVCGGVA